MIMMGNEILQQAITEISELISVENRITTAD